MIETENHGGQLWWSGFKTEQQGSINITTDGYHDYSTYPIAVEEIRGEEVRRLLDKEAHPRNLPFYTVPLYYGNAKK